MAFAEHEREHKQHAGDSEAPKAEAVHDAATPKTHKVHVKHVSAKTEKPKVDIDESLRAIYEDDAGEMPDMTKLEHARSRGWLFGALSLIAIGLLGGAAYVGYLVFAPYVLNANAKIDVTIEAVDSVKAFEETTVTVAYENIGRGPVGSGELRLNIPQEFTVTGTDPMPIADPATWAVPALAPGEKGSMTVKGYFMAEGGTRAFLQTVVRYSPQGIDTQYEDIATKTVSVSGSHLTLAMDAPSETVAGEKTSLTYRVKNAASMRIDHIVLSAKLPASFLVSESKPKAETDGSWKVGALEPGQEAKIAVTGTFSANHEENETLGGSVGVARDTLVATQAEAVSPIRVASSAFVLRTIVNGSADDQSVDFGGRLRLSSLFKNNGNRTMKDVTLTVTLDATPDGLIDWKTFDEETKDDKTFVRKGETITVNKKLYPSFGEVLPDAEGSLAWNIPLVPNALANAKQYGVKITSKATIGFIGNTKVNKTVETTPYTVTPNSDLRLSTGAYYFNEDDAPIGTGPIPPQVGSETKYIIAWKIMNSVHDLKDVQLKTQLAESVEWTGKTATEGGSLSFDPTTRTVTWKVDRLASTTPSISSQFEIALTPKTSQIDSFAPLTTGPTLTASDTITGSILTKAGTPDTTELPMDTAAKGKGLVVEAE